MIWNFVGSHTGTNLILSTNFWFFLAALTHLVTFWLLGDFDFEGKDCSLLHFSRVVSHYDDAGRNFFLLNNPVAPIILSFRFEINNDVLSWHHFLNELWVAFESGVSKRYADSYKDDLYARLALSNLSHLSYSVLGLIIELYLDSLVILSEISFGKPEIEIIKTFSLWHKLSCLVECICRTQFTILNF